MSNYTKHSKSRVPQGAVRRSAKDAAKLRRKLGLPANASEEAVEEKRLEKLAELQQRGNRSPDRQ